jgi:hypothetical protein
MIIGRKLPKRRYARYRHDAPVRAHVFASEATFFSIRGRCCELGEGGAGVTLNDQIPAGEVVSLELTPTLRVYAAVRYMRGFYHGFEFVMLRDRQREAVRQLCTSLAARYVKQPANA